MFAIGWGFLWVVNKATEAPALSRRDDAATRTGKAAGRLSLPLVRNDLSAIAARHGIGNWGAAFFTSEQNAHVGSHVPDKATIRLAERP